MRKGKGWRDWELQDIKPCGYCGIVLVETQWGNAKYVVSGQLHQWSIGKWQRWQLIWGAVQWGQVSDEWLAGRWKEMGSEQPRCESNTGGHGAVGGSEHVDKERVMGCWINPVGISPVPCTPFFPFLFSLFVFLSSYPCCFQLLLGWYGYCFQN